VAVIFTGDSHFYLQELMVLLPALLDIDPGKASAIALAMESRFSILILDDQKARKTAKRLNRNYTGTLGAFLIDE
jgi:predicted nucleic acid-binding protein